MVKPRKNTLRGKLATVLEGLCEADQDVLKSVHHFLLKKTAPNSSRNDCRQSTIDLPAPVGIMGAAVGEDTAAANASLQVPTPSPGLDVNDALLTVSPSICAAEFPNIGLAEQEEQEQASFAPLSVPGSHEVTPAKDEWEFSLARDKLPLVHGQSIVGLFSSNKTDSTDDYRFSNGFEVDLLHRVHSVMECPKEKQFSDKITASEGTNPSDALIVAAVNCFSKKKKRHFFRDGLYLCTVFSHELSMRLSTFLQVRGWVAKKRADGTVLISYRRIGDCLRLIGGFGANNYFQVSSMFDRLFRVLQSREIWPVMPYEEG